MACDSDLRQRDGSERRRAGMCLALIALLLYNPFFTILSSAHEVSVRHSLSYRATVASSELRRGTLEPATPLLPELTPAICWAAISLAPSHELAVALTRDAVAPVSQAPCDSIWFRPPPSA
jgi:hypothetical protein